MKCNMIFYNLTETINELKIYSAFFPERPVWMFNELGKAPIARVWSYSYGESHLYGLSNQIVFYYVKDKEAYLYDYSNILNIKVTENDYGLEYKIIKHDLSKEKLKVSEIKEILANNARAAIVAKKLEEQVKALDALKEDF